MQSTNDMCRTQRESLSSLVDGVVWTLVQRLSRRLFKPQQQVFDSRNVLAQGYVVASEALQKGHAVRPCPNMQPGVLCIHLNDNVSYCQTSKYFKFLHALLGDDCLRLLLLQTTLLIPVYPETEQQDWRGNYLQLCGPPMPISKNSILPSKQPPSVVMPKPQSRKKRKRGGNSSNAKPSETAPPHLNANTIVPRASLFYSDSFVPKIRLPLQHVLNDNLNPQRLLASMLEDLVRDNATNVTTIKTSKKATRIKCKRWWPRLQLSGLPICQEILQRHQKCDYARLLQRHCALPSFCRTKRSYSDNTAPSSIDPGLENPSLDQVVLAHSPAGHVMSFLASVLRRVFPLSFWGSEHNFQSVLHVVDVFVRLRRHERTCNHFLLHGFRVTDVSWLLGDIPTTTKLKLSKNQNLALVKRAICLIRWIVGKFVVPLLRSIFYVTEAEFSGRIVLYYRKPVWSLFRSLSMEKLLQKQYKELKRNDAMQRLHQQELGFSRLRLLPKATGVRPIAMLNVAFVDSAVPAKSNFNGPEEISCDEPIRRKPRLNLEGDRLPAAKRKRCESTTSAHVSKKHKQAKAERSVQPVRRAVPGGRGSADRTYSTNDILKETFDVMRFEVMKNLGLVGSGMFGLNEIYPRYSKFMRDINECRRRKDNVQLFFASVDINKCYDNIQQEHLLTLMRQELSGQDYLIQNYSLVFPFESTGRVFKRLKKKVGPPETFLPFHRTAKEMSDSHKNCIFIDGTRCLLAKRSATIRLLEEHLGNHVVVAKGRYGNRFLLQGNGIPQGSVLSSLLCNIYYGNVEKEILGEEFARDSNTTPECFLLVRMVDDFLLITTERSMAERFIKKMYSGSPSRGALINKEKTITSFNMEMRENGATLMLTDGRVKGAKGDLHFPWCGLLFDSETGEVRVDYSRFAGGKALGALTVDHIGEQGRRFALYLKTFVRPRCQSLLFDPHINSTTVIAINFYQMFLLCAVKAVDYIESSEMTMRSNQEFICRSIDEAISYARGLIMCRLRRDSLSLDTLNRPEGGADLSQESALWLGRHAFSVSFRRLGGELNCISDQLATKTHVRKHHSPLKTAVDIAMSEIKICGLL